MASFDIKLNSMIQEIGERVSDLERKEYLSVLSNARVQSNQLLFGASNGTLTQSADLAYNDTTKILNIRNLSSTTGTINLSSIGATVQTALEIGSLATGNRFAVIDLIGDDTYTDYGLRIIRNNSGANADSTINHRGTGVLAITAVDLGFIDLKVNNTTKVTITNSSLRSGVNTFIGGNVTTVPAYTLSIGDANNGFNYPSANGMNFMSSGVAIGGWRRGSILSGYYNDGIYIDLASSNYGTIEWGLRFGTDGSGEGIASKRTAAGNQNGLDFYTGHTRRGALSSGGNWSFGTIDPINPYRVYVVGANGLQANFAMVVRNGSLMNLFYAENTGFLWSNVAWTTSDIRAKKNIEPLIIGGDMIDSLNPIQFEYNEGQQGNIYGFSAQELKAVDTKLVRESSHCIHCNKLRGVEHDEVTDHVFEATLVVNHNMIIPLLVNALKDEKKKGKDRDALQASMQQDIAKLKLKP